MTRIYNDSLSYQPFHTPSVSISFQQQPPRAIVLINIPYHWVKQNTRCATIWAPECVCVAPSFVRMRPMVIPDTDRVQTYVSKTCFVLAQVPIRIGNWKLIGETYVRAITGLPRAFSTLVRTKGYVLEGFDTWESSIFGPNYRHLIESTAPTCNNVRICGSITKDHFNRVRRVIISLTPSVVILWSRFTSINFFAKDASHDSVTKFPWAEFAPPSWCEGCDWPWRPCKGHDRDRPCLFHFQMAGKK